MVRIAALSTLLILSIGCARHPSGPGAKILPELYGEPYQGVRSSPPELAGSHKRLDIFLGVPVQVAEGEERLEGSGKFEKIIYCVALNEDKHPLPEVTKLIEKTPPDKPIYVWGKPITQKKGIWWDGVDCEALAIGIWRVEAQRYLYYDLSYREGIRWRGVLKRAVEKGVKSGFKAVKP